MLQSRDKFKVGATSLEVIRNPQKYLDDHEAFELFELEDQIKRGGKDKFRFDLKYQHKQNKGKIFFVDTKNYESLSGIFSGKNLDQLKAYFREITEFSQLRIVQQKRGVHMTLESFAEVLRSAMKKDPNGFYSSNPNLFNSLRINGRAIIGDVEDFELFLTSADFTGSSLAKILTFTQ